MSEFLVNLLSKAKEKADALEKIPRPVLKKKENRTDTPSVSDTVNRPDTFVISDMITVSDTDNGPDTQPIPDTVDVSGISSYQPANSILTTYAALQSQINEQLPPLTPSALKLYVYLVIKSSDGVVHYNQRDIMKSVGFASHTTVVRAVSALEEMKLINWISKSNKRGEQSKLRVILPLNLSSTESPSIL